MSWLPRFGIFGCSGGDAFANIEDTDFEGRVLVIGWRVWRIEISITKAVP